MSRCNVEFPLYQRQGAKVDKVDSKDVNVGVDNPESRMDYDTNLEVDECSPRSWSTM